MTREDLDFIGSMNMRGEISNEAYKKIACHFEEQEPKIEWVTKWIPISERLPKIHQYILLSLKSFDIGVGFRVETEPYFYCHGHYIEFQNVLAWVPLPIPYKENEEILSEEPAFYDFRQSEKVKKCLVCDRYFSTTARNVKYCSPECQQKAVRMKRKEWHEKHENYYRDYFRVKRAKERIRKMSRTEEDTE